MVDEKKLKDATDPRLDVFDEDLSGDRKVVDIYELYRPMIEGRVCRAKSTKGARPIILSAVTKGEPQ